MPAYVRHVSINADDVERGRRFYEAVFGLKFAPWGPPGFYIDAETGGQVSGAIQGRRTVGGQAMPGLEVTFAVEDIAATVAAVEANGGAILMAPSVIEGVGELIYFRDSEGNVVGAMKYESARRP